MTNIEPPASPCRTTSRSASKLRGLMRPTSSISLSGGRPRYGILIVPANARRESGETETCESSSRQSEFFSANYRRISDHTNYQMAALSLQGVVQEIEAVLSQVAPSA